MEHSDVAIDIAEVDSLRWFNIRLSAIVKRSEASELRERAEKTDLIALGFEKQANAFLDEIQKKMDVGPDYEGVIQGDKLVFRRKDLLSQSEQPS